MRFVSICLVVLASCLAIFANPDARVLESQINDVLECVRQLLLDGIPDYGIPTFNPLEVESASVDLGEYGINGLSGTVAVENLYLAGITDFQQSNLKGTIGLIPLRYTFELTLTFPLTTLNTQYDVDVSYTPSDIHVYGAGELSFEAVNFAVDIEVTATVLGGITITNLEVDISLEGLNSFALTGLYNDEEYSAQLVETILANPSGVISQYAPTVNEVASTIAKDALNDALAGDGVLAGVADQCI